MHTASKADTFLSFRSLFFSFVSYQSFCDLILYTVLSPFHITITTLSQKYRKEFGAGLLDVYKLGAPQTSHLNVFKLYMTLQGTAHFDGALVICN